MKNNKKPTISMIVDLRNIMNTSLLFQTPEIQKIENYVIFKKYFL